MTVLNPAAISNQSSVQHDKLKVTLPPPPKKIKKKVVFLEQNYFKNNSNACRRQTLLPSITAAAPENKQGKELFLVTVAFVFPPRNSPDCVDNNFIRKANTAYARRTKAVVYLMPWISKLKFLLSSLSSPNIGIAACVRARVCVFVGLFICAMGDDCVTVASGVMMVPSLELMKDASCVHMAGERGGGDQCGGRGKGGVATCHLKNSVRLGGGGGNKRE